MAGIRYMWGIIGGLLLIIFYYILYIRGIEHFISTSMYYAGLIPMILCMIIGILHIKSQNTKLYDFKDVVSIAFAIYVIAVFIYWIFYYVMLEYVDPSIIVFQKEQAIQHTIEQYGETHSEVQRVRNTDFGIQFRYLLYSIAQGIVGGFIISAILAFIMRDK